MTFMGRMTAFVDGRVLIMILIGVFEKRKRLNGIRKLVFSNIIAMIVVLRWVGYEFSILCINYLLLHFFRCLVLLDQFSTCIMFLYG